MTTLEAVAIGSEEDHHGEQIQPGGKDAESTDSYRKLPHELRNVLLFLEGGCKTMIDLREEYSGFFSTQRNPSSYSLWPERVRMRLLGAVGNCKRLERIFLPPLTASELNTVFEPLSTSPALVILTVDFQIVDAESPDFESACSHLGNLLQGSRKLEHFALRLGRRNRHDEQGQRQDSLLSAGVSRLALGLQSNSLSVLERLDIEGWVEASVGVQIGNMIRWARQLKTLFLWEVKVDASDGDAVQGLAEGVRHNISLSLLLVRGCGSGVAEVLLGVFSGERQNTSIRELEIRGTVEGLRGALPTVLSSSLSLKDVTLDIERGMGFSRDEWMEVGRSLLRRSSSFERFEIRMIGSDKDRLDGVAMLLQSASSPSVAPIIALAVDVDDSTCMASLEDVEATSVWSPLADALCKSTSVQSLCFWVCSASTIPNIGAVLEALENNCSLPTLALRFCGADFVGGWCHFFKCLRRNTHLKRLELYHTSDLDDDAFKELMELLKVNSSLKEISLEETSWDDDGKEALVEEALKQYAKQDKYFAVVREASLSFENAKSGRLFLCGSPFAGKTQLRMRLTSQFQYKIVKLLRTKGIEVQMLRDDDVMQISIWDLAGQAIYRALHSILFPRTNESCVFVYLFNPFDDSQDTKGPLKPDLESTLRGELETWLRFIASSSQIKGRNLPHVLVVLTHMDRMANRVVSWARSVVDNLRVQYAGILDLCGGEEVEQINARSKTEVNVLKEKLYTLFQHRLDAESHLVPTVCSHIISKVIKQTSKKQFHPIWPCDEFYIFCTSKSGIKELEDVDPVSESGRKLLEAIVAYLHDVGTILVIPDSERIIMNPHWLTHTFLGKLITIGNKFQVDAIDRSRRTRRSHVSYHSEDGFVTQSKLQDMLSHFLGQHGKSKHMDQEILEHLLVKLELCFKLESEDGIVRCFIPMIIAEGEHEGGQGLQRRSERLLPPWMLCDKMEKYTGFRLQCADRKRTSFTSAFFPRLQIHLYHKVLTEFKLHKANVKCSRNWFQFCEDGHDVILEQDGGVGNHVDIFVRSSNDKTRQMTLHFVQTHVIEEVRAFCASSKGCPGVTLAVGILRPECVGQRIQCQYRDDSQAILIEDLKHKILKSIQDNIQHRAEVEFPKQRIHTHTSIQDNVEEEQLLTYMHTWPEVRGVLPAKSEQAIALLPDPERDVQDILKDVQDLHSRRLRNLVDLSRQLGDTLDHRESADGAAIMDPTGSSSSSSKHTTSLSCARREMIRCTSNVEGSNAQAVKLMLPTLIRLENKVDVLGDKVDVVDSRVQGIASRIQRIERELIGVQREVRSLLSAVLSQMDRIIGFTDRLAQAEFPRRPFFSCEDVRFFHKMTAKINIGKPVILHFLCESRSGPHEVPNQLGLELTMEIANREWLRSMSQISIQMFWFLLKAGVQVTTSSGGILPDLRNIPTATSLSVATTFLNSVDVKGMLSTPEKYDQSKSLEDAWLSLKDHIAPQLRDNIPKLFGLYKVRYVEYKEEGYAWICETCKASCHKRKIIEIL